MTHGYRLARILRSGAEVALSPTWVLTESWAIRKAKCESPETLETPAALVAYLPARKLVVKPEIDVFTDRIIDAVKRTTGYQMTGWTHRYGRAEHHARLYVNQETGRTVFLDADIVETLELEVVYGQAGSPCEFPMVNTNAGPVDVIIAPMRVELPDFDQLGHIDHIIRFIKESK